MVNNNQTEQEEWIENPEVTQPRFRRFKRYTSWFLMISFLIFICYYHYDRRFGPRVWEASAVAFSPDGSKLIVGAYQWRRVPYDRDPKHLVGKITQSVLSLNPETGEKLEEIEQVSSDIIRSGISAEPCSWINFSPKGDKIAIGHWDGTTDIRKTKKWKKELTLNSPSGFGFVRNISFFPDGKSICIGTRSFVEWIPLKLPEKKLVNTNVNKPYSISISPDGSLIAITSDYEECHIVKSNNFSVYRRYRWDKDDNNKKKTPSTSAASIRHVSFTPSGKELVISGATDKFRSTKIIDVDTGELIKLFNNYYGTIRFSPDGKSMAIGGYKSLTLIDTKTMKKQFHKPRPRIITLNFSPDSKRIVLGTWDGYVECRSTTNGSVLWKTYIGGF